MKRLKGIYQNCDPVDQPEGYYRDAKNVILDDKIGSILSDKVEYKESVFEHHENPVDEDAGQSFKILHIVETDGNNFIFFFNNDGFLRLRNTFTDPVFTTTIDVDDIDSVEIQSDSYVNKFGEKVIVFVTGQGPAYVYNVEKETITTLLPSVTSIPYITNGSVVETGGFLKAGTYYIALAYKHDDGSITNFYDVKGPFYINQSALGSSLFSGSDSSAVTSKSISLDFNHIKDTNYESFILAVIPVYDGIIGDVQILPEISINSSSYTYTGSEAYTPGSLAEIQIDKSFYETPKTVHVQEDVTYLGNLSKPVYNDIQAYVNSINVLPVVEILSEQYFTERTFTGQPNPIYIEPFSSFRDPDIARAFAGYKRGEVYAIYVSFLLKNGGETPAFHIPGRAAVGAEDAYTSGTNAERTFEVAPSVSAGSIIFSYNGKNVTVSYGTGTTTYEIQSQINTAYNTGQFDARIINVSTTSFTVQSRLLGGEGELSFGWDASNVTTSGFGIRVQGLNNYLVTGYADLDFIPATGYVVESTGTNATMGFWKNISEYYPDNFPNYANQNVRHHHFPEVKEVPLFTDVNGVKKPQVLGFRLDFPNDPLPSSLQNNILGYKVYYAKRTTANKRIVDQTVLIKARTDSNGLIPSRSYPDLGVPAYSSNQAYSHPFTLISDRINVGNITHIKQVMLGTLPTPTTYTYSGRCKMITANHIHNSIVTEPTHKLKAVNGAAYVDGTLQDSTTSLSGFGINGTINNKLGETKLVIDANVSFITNNKTYLTDLFSLKSNVYQSFDSQELVSTGYIHTNLNNLDSGNIFGGDTFLCNYVWKAYNNTDNQVCVHSAFVESSSNIAYRGAGLNPWESFYPLLSEGDYGSPVYDNGEFTTGSSGILNDNYISYNKSFSFPNQFKFPTILSKYNQTPEKYPTRVIRSSGKQNRLFLQDDFIDLPTKRGDLIKLDSYNNILIAHMERALIRTKGREELVAGDVTAFVGSGDIFAVKPEEIIYTSDGYGGIKKPSHSFASNYGYFFYDELAKKVFVLQSNGLKDLTDPIFPIIDPLLSNQRIGWGQDPKYGRVFLNTQTSLLSYSSKLENWISRHTWFGAGFNFMMANTKSGLYLLKETTTTVDLYSVNQTNTGYQNLDFLFSFVENLEPFDLKEFVSLEIQGYKDDNGKTYPVSSIKILTEDQNKETNIVDFNLQNPYIASARKVRNKWMINNLRDADNKRFRGNYFLVTLKDTVGEGDPVTTNKEILISDIITNYKKPVK